METNKKIIQYLKYKGISQRKFTNDLKMGEGVLRGGKNIGSGYLMRIKRYCPDLNMNWVLFDEGEMLLEGANLVSEAQTHYHNTRSLEKELALTKELLLSKDETILLLKERLAMYESKKETGS